MPFGYGLHKIILDDNGRPSDYVFIEVNKKYEEATGLKASEIIGRRITEVVPNIRNDSYDRIASYGEVAQNESELDIIQYSNEFKKWYRVTAYSPEKGYFITLFKDITKERTDFSIALESEKKLKNYLDFAPLGIIVINEIGKMLEANPEACRISGYSEEEMLTLNIQKLIAQSSQITALMFFKDVVKTGQAECEVVIKTKSGGLRWILINARILSKDKYTFYCQDITSYKSMEESLVESELLYKTFINASDDMIYLKDDHLQYIIVNDSFSDEIGLDNSEIIGKTDCELKSGLFAKISEKTDLEVLETRTSRVFEDTAENNKSYEIVKFPVPIGSGRTGVGAYIREVTEKKKQEEILKRTLERHRILANALMMTFKTGQEQFEYALQEALHLTGSQCGFVFLYDDQNHTLKMNSFTKGVLESCRITDMKDTYELDKTGLWGEAIRTQKPIIVNDFLKPSSLKRGFPPGHIALTNFMSIPVFVNEKIVAVVGLANKSVDYDDFDVSELSMLMNGVWTAVEKKNVQSRMENLLEQTQAMFNEHDAVMLLIKPDSGRIIDANPAAVSFYGYTKEELLNLKIDDINMMPEDEAKALRDQVYHLKTKFYSYPHYLKNGEKRIVDVYTCPINYNNEKVLFSIIFDVTEREQAFNEIKYLSYHDHMTGLFNRRYFDNMLKQMNDERYMPLTIVMADVNSLKLINDSYGHAKGDKLLIKAAELLSAGCRKDDVIARIGGDEFVVILPNTEARVADRIVRRIKKLQSKVKFKEHTLSMSFGYAVKYNASSDIEQIFSEAENKMYKNKMRESSNTKNRTVNSSRRTQK